MTERFFCPQIAGNSAILSGPEAHHLVHVMRAKPGDSVILFDGQGPEYTCKIEKIEKQRVLLTVLEVRPVDRELTRPLTVAAPLPKGDRQRVLVEKLTELGVTAFTPLITERTVVRPGPDVVERLTRIVVEASKQCGRNRLMTIQPPQPWPAFLESVTGDCPKFLAHPKETGEEVPPPEAASHSLLIDSREIEAEKPIVVAVGPEGGLTPNEVAAARERGWRLLDLGRRILRVETAAIVLATLFGVSREVRHW